MKLSVPRANTELFDFIRFWKNHSLEKNADDSLIRFHFASDFVLLNRLLRRSFKDQDQEKKLENPENEQKLIRDECKTRGIFN